MQVVEFVEFKERLDDAIGRASSHVESAFLRIRSAFHEGWPQAQACMHDVSRVLLFPWPPSLYVCLFKQGTVRIIVGSILKALQTERGELC